MHTQDLNEKIEFIIYISCIFLIFALCTLIYTDGSYEMNIISPLTD